MRKAHEILTNMNVDFEFDGEMHGDAALDDRIRNNDFGFSNLTGSANLLIMPDLDSANIAYNLLKTATNSATVVLNLTRCGQTCSHFDSVCNGSPYREYDGGCGNASTRNGKIMFA